MGRLVHCPSGICTGLMNETSGKCLGFVMHLPRNIFLLDVLHLHPPPFVIATPKYGINTVPTPTVA